jgi:hypothetical protein
MKLGRTILIAGCLLVTGTAGVSAQLAGLSGHGELRTGATVCFSRADLIAAASMATPTPEKLKSLGCVVNGAPRPAHCIICELQGKQVFVSLELRNSVEKAWVSKADLTGFGWF